MMRTGTWILVAVGMVAGVARADVPQTDEQKRADALFAEGRKLIEAGKNEEACTKFNEAIKLDPDAAGSMLNLGLCNQNLGKFKTALYWFRKAQVRAHETSLPEYEKAAGDHTKQLAEVVAAVKIVFTAAAPADVKVVIDGEEIKDTDFVHAEVDPGHHVLEATANGYKTHRQAFDVVDKGGQTLTIAMVPGNDADDRPMSRRTKGVIVGSIGGGLMLASAGVAVWAKLRYDSCVMGDPPTPVTTCNNGRDGVAEANHYHNIAAYGGTPLFVAGAVGVAIGAYLFFTKSSDARAEHALVLPALGPDQIGFAASGSF